RELRAGFPREALAELIAERPPRDLAHRSLRKVAQLERAKGDTDQTRHREAEMLHDLLDLAVLALAEADRKPGVRGLFPFQLRLDGAIQNAIERETVLQFGQAPLIDVAMDADAVAAEPARGGKLERAGKTAIVGEEQQPLGVDVEPPHGDHAGQLLGQGL